MGFDSQPAPWLRGLDLLGHGRQVHPEAPLSLPTGTLFDFTFMNAGQPYDDNAYRALLFTLPAVAGLAGATLANPQFVHDRDLRRAERQGS